MQAITFTLDNPDLQPGTPAQFTKEQLDRLLVANCGSAELVSIKYGSVNYFKSQDGKVQITFGGGFVKMELIADMEQRKASFTEAAITETIKDF